MYTRTYQLNSDKYPIGIDGVRNALMALQGVDEVELIDATNSIIVHFNNPLSEKQILNEINQYKRKH